MKPEHYQAAYFVRGRLLGTSEFWCPTTPHCLAYFCASCGDVWARAAVEPSHTWDALTVPCEQHSPQGVRDWGAVPGSLLGPGISSKSSMSSMDWARAIEHLPPEVIRREFEIHLNWHDKKELNNEIEAS